MGVKPNKYDFCDCNITIEQYELYTSTNFRNIFWDAQLQKKPERFLFRAFTINQTIIDDLNILSL